MLSSLVSGAILLLSLTLSLDTILYGFSSNVKFKPHVTKAMFKGVAWLVAEIYLGFGWLHQGFGGWLVRVSTPPTLVGWRRPLRLVGIGAGRTIQVAGLAISAVGRAMLAHLRTPPPQQRHQHGGHNPHP